MQNEITADLDGQFTRCGYLFVDQGTRYQLYFLHLFENNSQNCNWCATFFDNGVGHRVPGLQT